MTSVACQVSRAEGQGLSTLALLEFLRGEIPHLRGWSDEVGCAWLAWFASNGWLAWVERAGAQAADSPTRRFADSRLAGVVLWRPVDIAAAQAASAKDQEYHFLHDLEGDAIYIDACIAKDDAARVALWERVVERMGEREQVSFHRQHQPGKQLKIYNWDRFNTLIRRGKG